MQFPIASSDVRCASSDTKSCLFLFFQELFQLLVGGDDLIAPQDSPEKPTGPYTVPNSGTDEEYHGATRSDVWY